MQENSSEPKPASEIGLATPPVGLPAQPVTALPLTAEPVRIGAGLGIWLRDLIISLAISAFIIIFLYQPVKVEGTSMMP